MNLIKLPRENFNYFPTIWNDLFPHDVWSKDCQFQQIPAANIKDNDQDFTISLAVPGLKKDDIKINIKNNVLTISSETKDDKKEIVDAKKNFTRWEYNYNSFSRSFSLPNSVSSEKIEASLEHGELLVKIPKKLPTEVNGKEIQIK